MGACRQHFLEMINGQETLGMAEKFGHFKETEVSVIRKQWGLCILGSSTSQLKIHNFNDFS